MQSNLTVYVSDAELAGAASADAGADDTLQEARLLLFAVMDVTVAVLVSRTVPVTERSLTALLADIQPLMSRLSSSMTDFAYPSLVPRDARLPVWKFRVLWSRLIRIASRRRVLSLRARSLGYRAQTKRPSSSWQLLRMICSQVAVT